MTSFTKEENAVLRNSTSVDHPSWNETGQTDIAKLIVRPTLYVIQSLCLIRFPNWPKSELKNEVQSIESILLKSTLRCLEIGINTF